jgi:hypothetical protein
MSEMSRKKMPWWLRLKNRRGCLGNTQLYILQTLWGEYPLWDRDGEITHVPTPGSVRSNRYELCREDGQYRLFWWYKGKGRKKARALHSEPAHWGAVQGLIARGYLEVVEGDHFDEKCEYVGYRLK